MKKKEIIWREILYQATEKKRTEFTQKGLSLQFGFSLSTIFNSLKIPRQTGAIKVSGKGFRVEDAEKLLYYFATQRNIEKEVIYRSNVPLAPKEIEGLVLPSSIFACYSAYRKKYEEEPADYDKVFIYSSSEELQEIKKRFPFKKGFANFMVLKSDPHLSSFGELTPDVQTFADLWNMGDWYAKEYLNALKNKIFNF